MNRDPNKRRCALLATLVAGAFGLSTASAGNWPNTFTARVEALALLQTLNAELLSHDSATATLERWCGAHHLASPAQVTAELVSGGDKAAGAEQRSLLHVDASERVRYRHVRLKCGAVPLSEADNWYVPSRLTPQMNRLLDSTDTPFGKVIGPLNFQRHTLSASLLWLPLPDGWETGSPLPDDHDPGLSIPAAVLEHRAVLTLPDGVPISEVVETYSHNVLAFDFPVQPEDMSKSIIH
jgi:chorismate-pyruvate lyase